MDPIAAPKAISTLTNGFVPSFHISFQLNRSVVALILREIDNKMAKWSSFVENSQPQGLRRRGRLRKLTRLIIPADRPCLTLPAILRTPR
jgi:hypothetical protein